MLSCFNSVICACLCSSDRGPVGSSVYLLQAKKPPSADTISAAVVLQQALPAGARACTPNQVTCS